MIGMEVAVNGKPSCVAAIENGVLTAMVTHLVKGQDASILHLDLGGLDSETQDHCRWLRVNLAVGDVITVKIVDTLVADPPQKKHRSEE